MIFISNNIFSQSFNTDAEGKPDCEFASCPDSASRRFGTDSYHYHTICISPASLKSLQQATPSSSRSSALFIPSYSALATTLSRLLHKRQLCYRGTSYLAKYNISSDINTLLVYLVQNTDTLSYFRIY